MRLQVSVQMMRWNWRRTGQELTSSTGHPYEWWKNLHDSKLKRNKENLHSVRAITLELCLIYTMRKSSCISLMPWFAIELQLKKIVMYHRGFDTFMRCVFFYCFFFSTNQYQFTVCCKKVDHRIHLTRKWCVMLGMGVRQINFVFLLQNTNYLSKT